MITILQTSTSRPTHAMRTRVVGSKNPCSPQMLPCRCRVSWNRKTDCKKHISILKWLVKHIMRFMEKQMTPPSYPSGWSCRWPIPKVTAKVKWLWRWLIIYSSPWNKEKMNWIKTIADKYRKTRTSMATPRTGWLPKDMLALMSSRRTWTKSQVGA
jgi:hypothetical protein